MSALMVQMTRRDWEHGKVRGNAAKACSELCGMLSEQARMEGVRSALTLPDQLQGTKQAKHPGRCGWVKLGSTMHPSHHSSNPWFESSSAFRKDGVLPIESTHRTRSN